MPEILSVVTQATILSSIITGMLIAGLSLIINRRYRPGEIEVVA